jgi:hypothetical protein
MDAGRSVPGAEAALLSVSCRGLLPHPACVVTGGWMDGGGGGALMQRLKRDRAELRTKESAAQEREAERKRKHSAELAQVRRCAASASASSSAAAAAAAHCALHTAQAPIVR